MPYKGIIMATLISQMIVPLIISGVAIFFFMAKVGLAATHTGIVLAHIILGTPFVVITVTATLSGFDHSVTRAAASLGSNPVNTFMKITLPLILPGVISGGLFAFVTSFDEVVVVLFLAGFENTTIPVCVAARPTFAMKKKIATPDIIKGTIIGEIKVAIIIPLYGICLLLSPKAAKVPKIIEPIVANIAIIKLFFAANPQGFLVP